MLDLCARIPRSCDLVTLMSLRMAGMVARFAPRCPIVQARCALHLRLPCLHALIVSAVCELLVLKNAGIDGSA